MGVVPRLVPLAAKESTAPGQIVSCRALMLSVGVTSAVMAAVRVLDRALSGAAHDKDEMSLHWIIAPDASEELMKVLLLVPAIAPFTLH